MLSNRPPDATTATLDDHLSALSATTFMASNDGFLSKVSPFLASTSILPDLALASADEVNQPCEEVTRHPYQSTMGRVEVDLKKKGQLKHIRMVTPSQTY